MDLKTRLQALQQAAGARSSTDTRPTGARSSADTQRAAAAGTATDAPQTANCERLAQNRQRREQALAAALGARQVSEGLLYREEILPGSYRHGSPCLADVTGIGRDPLGVAIPPVGRGWLFFDTETTGLAGGTGTLVFLFGAVHFDGAVFTLQQWLLTRFAGEAALIRAVGQAFAQSALLVSFNGKSFDLPLLRTRARLQGSALAESHLAHLDLLHPARSAFAGRWPDVRLQTAERRLCQFQRSDDLPGSEAPAAFARWLRAGEGDGLLRVMQHHRDDVLSLVTLSTVLSDIYRDPLAWQANEDGIVRRMRRRGYRVRAGQGQLALLT